MVIDIICQCGEVIPLEDVKLGIPLVYVDKDGVHIKAYMECPECGAWDSAEGVLDYFRWEYRK